MRPDHEDGRHERPEAGPPSNGTSAGPGQARSAPTGPAYAVHNATVHSTSEPYADAFIVEDGTVSWIGAEESVRHLPGQPAQRCDAGGALAAPAFTGWLHLTPSFDGERTTEEEVRGLRQRMEAALGRGVGLLRLSVHVPVGHELAENPVREQVARGVAEIICAAAAHPIPVQPIIGFRGAGAGEIGGSDDPTRRASAVLRSIESHLDDALVSATRAGGDAGSEISAPSGLISRELAVEFPAGLLGDASPEKALEVLFGWRRFARDEGRQLILAADRSDARPHADGVAAESPQPGMDDAAAARFVEILAATHRELLAQGRSAAPGRPSIVVGFDTPERQLWERLLNTAVHVCFTSAGHVATALSVGVPAFAATPEGENPWELIAGLVHRETDSLSVRAAFNAHVRGARRALPAEAAQPPASLGHLNAGEPATFALWEADALAVQTPESRVAAWSTDARSRTPLLPYLDGVSLPHLRATVIEGVWHHITQSRD